MDESFLLLFFKKEALRLHFYLLPTWAVTKKAAKTFYPFCCRRLLPGPSAADAVGPPQCGLVQYGATCGGVLGRAPFELAVRQTVAAGHENEFDRAKTQ